MKYIISCIMYIIGFVMYISFLIAARNISTEAWGYAIGASFGVLLFTLSRDIRK